MSVNEASQFKFYKKDYSEIKRFNRLNDSNSRKKLKVIKHENRLIEEYLKKMGSK